MGDEGKALLFNIFFQEALSEPFCTRLDNPSRMLRTRDVAVVATFTGMIVGSDFALSGVTNVKLLDTLVFTHAFAGILGWYLEAKTREHGDSENCTSQSLDHRSHPHLLQVSNGPLYRNP